MVKTSPSNAGGVGSIPGQGAKIPHASWPKKTKHKKKYYNKFNKDFKNGPHLTSLVVQWLRIRLPMEGTWVRALAQEDPTCRGATKPVCHKTTEPAL